MEKTLYTFIIFSENTAGVLNEITSVFARRQVNIESLNTSASSIEGIHRYTLTCLCSEEIARKSTKQIAKKIGVVRCNFYKENEIFIEEVALFKISTEKLLAHADISKAIRLHDGSIVEVNPVYAIVSLVAMTDEIKSLYNALSQFDCIFQFVRSGAIAITKNKREYLSEYLDDKLKRYEEQQRKTK